MAVPTLPRTTTCSSSMAGRFYSFTHDERFIALSNKAIREKTLSKQVRFSQTGCIDHPQKSIQPVCFHILIFIIKYDWGD